MTTTSNDLTSAELAEAVRDEIDAALEAAQAGGGKTVIRQRLVAALGWLKDRTGRNERLTSLAATIAAITLDRGRKDLIEDLEAVMDETETVLAELESDESE
jgi:hypothetical protein